VYDNSSSLSLAGSGITILGQSAGLLALTLAGVLFLVVGGALSLSSRRNRRDSA
jgi:hypothetical protein